MENESGAAADEVIDRIAQRILAERDRFIEELSAQIRSQVTTLDRDPRLRELMEAGTTDNLTAALEFLGGSAGAADVRAPERAVVYARTLARHDVPASALIRAYRIGQAGFLDVAMRYAVELGGPGTAQVIMRMVNRTATYIDHVCEQVCNAYEQERDRWVGSRGGLRQQWVNRLLDGTATDFDVAEQVLQYPLGGHHVAVNAWTDPQIAAADAAEVLDHLRLTLAAIFGRARTLMVPVDEHEVRLWLSPTMASAVDTATIEHALTERSLRARMVISGSSSGVAGFRRTAGQAERVRRIALLTGNGDARVLSYPDMAATALLAHDIGTLREFVAEQLGELAVDNQRNVWLRETLRTFLAHNNSYAAAAEILTVHRNTVQYRVRQALDLIGGHPETPDADLHLRLALQAAYRLGTAVLQPGSPVH